MKTVVFDLGGVLIDWNPRNMYKKYLNHEQMDFLLGEVCTMEWNALMDAGLSFKKGADLLSKKYPEHEAMIRKYGEEWPDMIGGEITKTVSILESLHNQQFPLYALTNWSMETFPPMIERFGFLKRFKGIVISAEEGICKPDERLYRILFDRYNIEPEESIFIDDSLPNVQSAQRLGMTAFHFNNADRLAFDLQSVLPEFENK